MDRFTISLDERLARDVDHLVASRSYTSRSEALRDILRAALEAARLEQNAAPYCVGVLSYVFNHEQRDLAERLTHLAHGSHDLIVAATHVHLDHENCLETVILRGETPAVRTFAESITAQRGVRHGHLNLVPVDIETGADHDHRHVHTRPKS